MAGPKIEFRDWIAVELETADDMLRAENPPDRLQVLAAASTEQAPDLRAGWLMGYVDALNSVLSTASPAILTRKMDLPPEMPGSPGAPMAGSGRAVRPTTVGDLRAFLARTDLPDELPVVVGGRDFDDRSMVWNGMADDVWTDDQGAFGGRLCLAAMGLGLVATKNGHPT